MTDPSHDKIKDEAVVQALAERLIKYRLPRALGLKERVDGGEKLDELDIEFLEEVFSDASSLRPLIDEHPEWQDVAVRLLDLYKDITSKALENEKGS